MNACKLILCDLREGILCNKRMLVIPLLGIFECLYADMSIRSITAESQQATFLDLLTAIFQGCDPIAQLTEHGASPPYFWLAIFLLFLFIIFDYLHKDLTHFGLQILSRARGRIAWWSAKCAWILLSGVCCYALLLLTVLAYSLCRGYTLSLQNTPALTQALASASSFYSPDGDLTMTAGQGFFLLMLPLVLICTLYIMQMTLTLFCKPLIGYIIMTVLLIFGILFDAGVVFPRTGMMLMSDLTMKFGYDPVSGLTLCLILTTVCVAAGGLYFQNYDILPDKE